MVVGDGEPFTERQKLQVKGGSRDQTEVKLRAWKIQTGKQGKVRLSEETSLLILQRNRCRESGEVIDF